MIRYRLEMSPPVRQLIAHLPPQFKRRVKIALQCIAENPYLAKELKEELAGLRSQRIGRARIIFRIKGSVVEIIAIGPRRDIYERVAAEISIALRKNQNQES